MSAILLKLWYLKWWMQSTIYMTFPSYHCWKKLPGHNPGIVISKVLGVMLFNWIRSQFRGLWMYVFLFRRSKASHPNWYNNYDQLCMCMCVSVCVTPIHLWRLFIFTDCQDLNNYPYYTTVRRLVFSLTNWRKIFHLFSKSNGNNFDSVLLLKFNWGYFAYILRFFCAFENFELLIRFPSIHSIPLLRLGRWNQINPSYGKYIFYYSCKTMNGRVGKSTIRRFQGLFSHSNNV